MSGLRDCRRSQPFAVSTAGAIRIDPSAPVGSLPGSSIGASFSSFIPAFDYVPAFMAGRAVHGSDSNRVRPDDETKEFCQIYQEFFRG